MTRTPAAHALLTTPLHRMARTVLICGSVLSILLSMGTITMVRLGVVAAVVTAVVACSAAWREVADVRRRAEKRAGDVLVAHGDQLRDERRRHLAVMDVLRDRADGLRISLRAETVRADRLERAAAALAEVLGDARSENGLLAGRILDLRHELDQAQEAVAELSADNDELRLANHEIEVRLLAGEQRASEAEVVELRRRA